MYNSDVGTLFIAGSKVVGECKDIYLQGRIEPVLGDVTILGETC